MDHASQLNPTLHVVATSDVLIVTSAGLRIDPEFAIVARIFNRVGTLYYADINGDFETETPDAGIFACFRHVYTIDQGRPKLVTRKLPCGVLLSHEPLSEDDRWGYPALLSVARGDYSKDYTVVACSDDMPGIEDHANASLMLPVLDPVPTLMMALARIIRKRHQRYRICLSWR